MCVGGGGGGGGGGGNGKKKHTLFSVFLLSSLLSLSISSCMAASLPSKSALISAINS